MELHLRTIPIIGDRSVWQDGRIQPGADWKSEIELALKRTKVAVLLVGPNFLVSEFIMGKELPQLLQAAQTDGVRIFPLITHRVAYGRSALGKFQSFNPRRARSKINRSVAQPKGPSRIGRRSRKDL